jgi:hypothetical protein
MGRRSIRHLRRRCADEQHSRRGPLDLEVDHNDMRRQRETSAAAFGTYESSCYPVANVIGTRCSTRAFERLIAHLFEAPARRTWTLRLQGNEHGIRR